MGETMLVKDAAVLWNITPRAVTTLCKEGKIQGARKEKGVWKIPTDAQRPVDHRYKTENRKQGLTNPYHYDSFINNLTN